MVQTRGTRRIGVAALCVALTFGRAAIAAPPPVSIPVDPDSYQTGGANGGPFAFLDSWQRTNYLLGDMWGLRSWMSQYGFSLAIQETSEVLGNVTGGNRRGFDYDGLTTMILQGDTNRAFGWYASVSSAIPGPASSRSTRNCPAST